MTFLVAILVFILDALTKFLATSTLPQGQSINVAGSLFRLTLVLNSGTAFGLFRGKTVFFILLSVVVIAFIISYAKKNNMKDIGLAMALGLILGGAAGNLADRVRFGYVVDFLDFRIWPVFNIADSAITIGMAIVAWKLLRSHKTG